MSNAIKLYRAVHDLTLEQFGELVGVNKAAVWKWERGCGPSFDKVLEIEAATKGELTRSDIRPDIYPPVKDRRAS